MANYFSSHLNTALQLIRGFAGSQPLHHYLKSYFSAHKKYGSKDRKTISHICYCYYRLGRALPELATEERASVALFLCNDERGNWLSSYKADWQQAFDESLEKRIRFANEKYSFSVFDIFFRNDWLSHDIEAKLFNQSHLIQPLLFLRSRRGEQQRVAEKLQSRNIAFQKRGDSCFALDNATKIDTIISLNKEAVIQDESSQKISSFFALMMFSKPVSAWDCCAASGGKSILLSDYFPNINLFVSDVRRSIIQNLKQRFREAGIHSYTSFIADISSPDFKPEQQYDLVICDAPCSGSGTWSRTPEQLYFFTEAKLQHYVLLQKRITENALQAVAPNGYFLYITCSVFKQENEDRVEEIKKNSGFSLLKKEMISGYDKKADTLFAALFQRL